MPNVLRLLDILDVEEILFEFFLGDEVRRLVVVLGELAHLLGCRIPECAQTCLGVEETRSFSFASQS